MHELSIAQNIAQHVIEVALSNQVSKVKSILIELGPLSGVVEKSLVFCFPEAVKDTILENTVLNIEKVPLKIRCNDCGKPASLKDINLQCITCKSSNVEILAGRELNIKSIEVE